MTIANGLVLPNTITNGQTSDATTVMADFNYLLGALNRALVDSGGGAGVDAQTTQIHNVATGTVSGDAVNLGQMNTAVGTCLPKAGGTMTGAITLNPSAAGGAGLNFGAGVAPTTPNNGDMWATTTLLQARLNGVTQTLLTLAGGTMTGLLVTVASATGSAGLRVPAGVAPTTPVDGDAWGTSTLPLLIYRNAVTYQMATTSLAETFTNKRINLRVSSTTSGTSVTPDVSAQDYYAYTALAAGLTINAPTGTPVDGSRLILRFKDNGTPQTLSWNAAFRAFDTALPTTTTASKNLYVGCIYNAADSLWDVVLVTQQP